MTLVLVRVDCRLIHGQIIEAWTPFTRADCLMVANDEVADDFVQRSIMEMSVPPTIEVAVMPVKEAARKLSNGRFADKRVILLLASCADALEFVRTGPRFDRLNLGNLHCSMDKQYLNLTCSVSLDTNDLRCLRAISDSGILIEARSVPQDPSRPLPAMADFPPAAIC